MIDRDQFERLIAEGKTQRERPELFWLIPADQVCFCEACYELHRCKHCVRWERHITVIERSPRNNPLGRWAHVSEFHDEGCPALILDPDSEVVRKDLIPEQLPFGPRGRYQPIPAAKCLDLDTRQWPGDTWLYRAFDDAGDLLYVGITNNVAQRMRAHRRKSRWWPRCDYVELADFRERVDARAAERRAIRTEMPRFNDAD